MRIFTRYLALEIIGPFFFGVTAFTAIIVGFTLVRLSQNPLLSGGTVLRLTVFAIPENLALAFPMGILLGTLFALGRLSSHSEVVAMRASGLSGLRLMAPFVLFGFIASLVNLFLTQNVVPVSHRSFSRELAQASGQGTKTILRRLVLEPAYDANGALKRLIHVGVFDLKDLYARDVAIVEFEAGRPRSVIQADEMAWDGRAWQFRRGWITRLDEGGGTSRLTVREGRVDYQPLLPKPREIALSATDPLNMNWFEFKEFIAKRQRDGKDVRRFLVELYTRLALPFACLALAVAGTPLGVQPHRSGSAVSFGLAMAVLLFYYFLLSFGQVLGSSGVLPPVLAAWSANLILCGAGIGFFFWRLR